MELIANRHIHEALTEKGLMIARTLAGNYMTSLDMEGFSITLLKPGFYLHLKVSSPYTYRNRMIAGTIY